VSVRLRLILAVVCVLAGVAALVGPAVGVRIIQNRVLERVSTRLGRPVTAEKIRVGWGRVALGNVQIGGGAPGLPTLVSVPKVTARFSVLALLGGKISIGEVKLYWPRLTLVRAQGYDNITSLLESLRTPHTGSGGSGRSTQIEKITVVEGAIAVADEQQGEAQITSIDGWLHPDGPGQVILTGISGHTGRMRGTAEKITVNMMLAHGRLQGLPTVDVVGSTVTPLKGLALTGIVGSLSPDPDGERAQIDVRGSYAGATTELWNARGWVDPKGLKAGELKVRAARFRLSQLDSVLGQADAPIRVLDSKNAEVDGRLDVVLDAGVLRFSGAGHLAGLTLAHPGLAPIPVSHIGFDATLKGSYDLAGRKLSVDMLTVERGNVRGTFTMVIDKKTRHYAASLKVTPVPCQTVLQAIPPELVPNLQGFKLSGTFSTDLMLDVSWVVPQPGTPNLPANLPEGTLIPEVQLGGKVGIEGCRVVAAAPAMDAGNLTSSFEQTVQVEPGKWRSFQAGPENPGWTPYAEISKHLVNSIMTTEDNGFFRHRGFIASEFRSALQQNLQRGYFRLGASSISMQMVKNVLLSREKTLSRKLQELFLTWYLEHQLSKERILEIYFNVIEFGPDIYGIGAAAQHYFGKLPKDLEPQEAAFFSSILPSPKRRYVQYCHATGTLDAKWDAYVKRIMRKNHERGRLTDEEFNKANSTPFKFDRKAAMPEKECMAYVKRLAPPLSPPPNR